jgi:hypothetical protein
VGNLPGVFRGEHIFLFEASTTTPGGTTFTQKEEFTGLLSPLMGQNFVARAIGMHDGTKSGWAKYNLDLKKWCEESTGAK